MAHWRKHLHFARDQKIAIIALIATALFCISAFVVVGGGYGPLELAVFRAINNLPDIIRPLFLFFTMLGSELVLIPVLIFAWLTKKYKLAILVVISAGSAYIMVKIFKLLVERERPFLVLSDVHQRVEETGYAFPSGHTAFAAAIGVMLVLLLGARWRWVAVILIGLVAASRLYLGVHTTLDVVAGACLGTLAAIGTLYLLPWMRKKTQAVWLAIRK